MKKYKHSIAITLWAIVEFLNWQFAIYHSTKAETFAFIAFIIVSALGVLSWIFAFVERHD